MRCSCLHYRHHHHHHQHHHIRSTLKALSECIPPLRWLFGLQSSGIIDQAPQGGSERGVEGWEKVAGGFVQKKKTSRNPGRRLVFSTQEAAHPSSHRASTGTHIWTRFIWMWLKRLVKYWAATSIGLDSPGGAANTPRADALLEIQWRGSCVSDYSAAKDLQPEEGSSWHSRRYLCENGEEEGNIMLIGLYCC